MEVIGLKIEARFIVAYFCHNITKTLPKNLYAHGTHIEIQYLVCFSPNRNLQFGAVTHRLCSEFRVRYRIVNDSDEIAFMSSLATTHLGYLRCIASFFFSLIISFLNIMPYQISFPCMCITYPV